MLPEERAALAELAFHHADKGGGRPYFLLSAVYSWAYLFPDDPRISRAVQPRVRMACDLYNRGLTEAEERQGPRPQEWDLRHPLRDHGGVARPERAPLGRARAGESRPHRRAAGGGAPDVLPLDRHRRAARRRGEAGPGSTDVDLLAPRARVPVTVLARFSDLDAQLRAGDVRATLEVYPGYGERTVTIAGRDVPLEAEPTAAIALMLSESDVWKRELIGFLRSGIINKKTRLVSIRPYEPGLIPVVFVHGTASSAARWAQMTNELDNDPRIHKHFQFWFFCTRPATSPLGNVLQSAHRRGCQARPRRTRRSAPPSS
jgi:hypothetical protein